MPLWNDNSYVVKMYEIEQQFQLTETNNWEDDKIRRTFAAIRNFFDSLDKCTLDQRVVCLDP